MKPTSKSKLNSIRIFLPQPNGHMNGDRIHMIPQNGKGGVIFPIWTDEIWYHVLANCICRFIRTERIDSFDMGCFDMKCCYPISSKHLTLQSVFPLWRHFDRYLNISLGQVSRALADGQQLVKCFQSASWVNWRSTLTKMSHYQGSYKMRSNVCQPGFRDPQQPTQWTIDRLLRWHAI